MGTKPRFFAGLVSRLKRGFVYPLEGIGSNKATLLDSSKINEVYFRDKGRNDTGV